MKYNTLTILTTFLAALPVINTSPASAKEHSTHFASTACPFCSAVSQTLRQEMEQMDAVAIARLVAGTETESDAEFEVLSVLGGERLVKNEEHLRVNYFGKAKPDQEFLLMGVDPPDLLWSSPLPVSEAAIKYVNAIRKLPKDPIKRLEFYLGYLENSESMLARDAYDEFASAPYSELKTLGPQLDRQQLLTWIQDSSLPPDRRRLYLVMLGVCGKPEDAKLLEKMLRSDDANLRAGLDSMIACYVTLRGAEGLKLIDELFLANKNSPYPDTYAAIMALRFHGTDGGVVPKDRILESMRLVLNRPELADLVIPDLARWEDWSQIDKLAELFKSADEKSSWVRVPVINYLRTCPLPEAEKKLDELKEIDPAAFKRATSFFPVPKNSNGSSDSSSIMDVDSVRGLAVSDVPKALKSGQVLASAAVVVPASAPRTVPLEVSATVNAMLPNLAITLSVLSMAAITLWLMMWLSISGAGNHGVIAWTLCRVSGNA